MASARSTDLSENLFIPDEVEDDTPSSAFLEQMDETRKKVENRKSRPKVIAASVFNRSLVEVDEMIRSGDWSGATAAHLVALYERMHEKCYGVAPAELGPTGCYDARNLAAGMMRREFSNDPTEMVQYMRWAWEREMEREEWRRKNGRDGGRVGVRLMFGGALLTDYRLHLARSGRLT